MAEKRNKFSNIMREKGYQYTGLFVDQLTAELIYRDWIGAYVLWVLMLYFAAKKKWDQSSYS